MKAKRTFAILLILALSAVVLCAAGQASSDAWPMLSNILNRRLVIHDSWNDGRGFTVGEDHTLAFSSYEGSAVYWYNIVETWTIERAELKSAHVVGLVLGNFISAIESGENENGEYEVEATPYRSAGEIICIALPGATEEEVSDFGFDMSWEEYEEAEWNGEELTPVYKSDQYYIRVPSEYYESQYEPADLLDPAE